jgi:hypothetical protein
MILILALACSDKLPHDSDSDPGVQPFEWDEASTVCGTIEGPQDTGCELPETVDIWTVQDGSAACDDRGIWNDTATDEYIDWRDELVASPSVSPSGRFQAEVEPGSYGAHSWESCYACAPVEVSEDDEGCVEVDLQLQPVIYVDAPNVYLYPTEPTPTRVQVGSARNITISEPEYPHGGWQTVATPAGDVFTREGVYDYLFYELRVPADLFQDEAGWCVQGGQAQASIEDAMAVYGFNEAEIEDFSEFWDPYFPERGWITVRPQVEGLPGLRITPAPEHLLRVWFVVEPGCQPLLEPLVEPVPRVGYHASEWGVILDNDFEREWLQAL